MAKTQLEHGVLNAMMSIGVQGPADRYLGICGNVTQILGEDAELDDAIDNLLTDLFKDWEHHSGSTAYPIGNWAEKPHQLFWHYNDSRKDMWDGRHKYGQHRWLLLQHCITKLDAR